jgi:alpha-galactosidase
VTADPTVTAGIPGVERSTWRLDRAGVSIAFFLPDTGLPEIVHWGGRLDPADEVSALRRAQRRGIGPSSLDAAWASTILPTEADGWGGRPALTGRRGSRLLIPRWSVTAVDASADAVIFSASADGVDLVSTFALDARGVLRVVHTITNTGPGVVEISSLEAVLPTGDAARESLDFSGRWVRERSPQRAPLREGSRTRTSHRGRTGHDSPFLEIVGTAGFTASAGEVWGTHLAWSGDVVYRTDALPETGPFLGTGALLRPAEIRLEPGAAFTAPTAYFVWSDTGLDGLAARLHASLRDRPTHPRAPRPVTLNTWEAVYFSHDLDALTALARVGAEVGVERFVLDDGWFRGRRNDRAGLGDWAVDPDVWPDGLHPLTDVVRDLGMQFGLWVEPEMVNLDSDLARQHPEWLLQPVEDGALSWRNQYVLDLGRDDVREHLREAISAIVAEYRPAYLKWDQNRDVHEALAGGEAALFRHTTGVYRLIDELKARHPGLEIESCASGGARIDLGIIERTDRVWASDTNDPLERLEIQRWTELLLPPELIGAHVGPPVAHTTGRATELSFRIATAFFDSFGIEWDISSTSAEERAELRDAIAAYKRLRPLLHSATLRHLDLGEESLHTTAAISPSRDRAVVRVARTVSGARSLAERLRVPGLDPDRLYDVRPVAGLRLPRTSDQVLPEWMRDGEAVLSGSALAAAGVRLPTLRPQQALILEITARAGDASISS